MRKWLAASALLHILIIIVLWLGLPQFSKPLPEPPVFIPIEIAQLAPVSAAKVQDHKEEPREPQKEPPKPEVKPEPPKPAPSQPEPPKPQPKPPEPKTEAIPAPTPKPKPPEIKPKPEPKKPDALASILKNVAKLKNEPKKTDEKPVVKPPLTNPDPTPPMPPHNEPKPATSAPSAPLMADKLSISEEDMLRQQIRGCWNVPIGARDIENITVEIYIQINPDRTLKDAIVVDQARLNRDSFFRAVAESALRALRNPRCSPLALPPEKYQQWQETIFNFNPKDMF